MSVLGLQTIPENDVVVAFVVEVVGDALPNVES